MLKLRNAINAGGYEPFGPFALEPGERLGELEAVAALFRALGGLIETQARVAAQADREVAGPPAVQAG